MKTNLVYLFKYKIFILILIFNYNNFVFSSDIQTQNDTFIIHNDKLKNTDGLGGKVISTVNYKIAKNKHHYGLTFHIGYKSNGYSLGERLSESLILRSGFTFRFVHSE